MSLLSFAELFAAADALAQPVGVAAAGGADPTVIEALSLASQRGWVRPILTGDPARIQGIATELGVDLSPFEIIEDADDSALAAVAAIHAGRAQLLMKGQLPTPSLMKAILDKQNGLRTGQTICQIVLMEIEKDQRSFLMADTGITVQPTLEQKKQITSLTAQAARRLGSARPRIAVMSATEKVNAAIPDTLNAEQLTTLGAQGEFGDCVVQGPLSFDLAYAEDAGRKKSFGGEVAGAADAMVFPDLLSANLTVKAMMYTAHCRFGGILGGTSSPVVFMSRADSVPTRLNSLAYAIQYLSEGT